MKTQGCLSPRPRPQAQLLIDRRETHHKSCPGLAPPGRRLHITPGASHRPAFCSSIVSIQIRGERWPEDLGLLFDWTIVATASHSFNSQQFTLAITPSKPQSSKVFIHSRACSRASCPADLVSATQHQSHQPGTAGHTEAHRGRGLTASSGQRSRRVKRVVPLAGFRRSG